MSDDRRGLPRILRIVLVAVVAVLVLVLLFTVVFPWVERNLSDPTLGAAETPVSSRR